MSAAGAAARPGSSTGGSRSSADSDAKVVAVREDCLLSASKRFLAVA